VKINLGCGTNKLQGWENHDADIDITSSLPWCENTVDFILAEHVVEHVQYREAIMFMMECHRILRPGGVFRVIVPSVERILWHADDEYVKFVSRWAKTPNKRGAIGAILWEHGHKTPWTESLMLTTLYYAGFGDTKVLEPRVSDHLELQDVDGHWKVIGEHNNWVESSVVEATKARS